MIGVAALTMSCDQKDISLTVTNRLPNVELREVIWDGKYLAGGLLPGETGKFETTCLDSDDEWPSAGPIEFRMSLNGKIVYVITKEIIELDCGSQIEFEVNDSTEIEIF